MSNLEDRKQKCRLGTASNETTWGLQLVFGRQTLALSLHVMQKDGGEGTWKVPRIRTSLLALKTETEGDDRFGTWFIL